MCPEKYAQIERERERERDLEGEVEPVAGFESHAETLGFPLGVLRMFQKWKGAAPVI
jgi:hypothetical protein